MKENSVVRNAACWASLVWSNTVGVARSGQPPRRYRIRSRMGLMAGLLLALACSESNDITGPGANQDPAQIYARLELTYHAITLSTVAGLDTMTLEATPRTPTGAVFRTNAASGQPTTFQVAENDPTLSVTPEGRLTAHAPSDGVLVIATRTIGEVTMIDTAVVRITNQPAPSPAVTAISIQPLPGDSAKVDCSGRFIDTLVARGMNAAGQSVETSVFAVYRSADTTIAKIDSTGIVTGVRPGHVMLYANAYVYDHGLRDSVRYTIGNPLVQLIWVLSRTTLASPTPMSYLSPADVTIGVGGIVDWMNGSTAPIDIMFDDSTAATPAVGATGFIFIATGALLRGSFDACAEQGGGHIAPLPVAAEGSIFGQSIPCANVGARSFPRAGTYTYHSALTGVTGRVIVQ